MADEILDIKQAAEYLQIKERTLYRLVGDGEIPGIKVGGQWRFSKKCLDSMFLKVTERKPRIKRIRHQEEPVVINSSDFSG
jgi:excisionase family DNA binding protein